MKLQTNEGQAYLAKFWREVSEINPKKLFYFLKFSMEIFSIKEN